MPHHQVPGLAEWTCHIIVLSVDVGALGKMAIMLRSLDSQLISLLSLDLDKFAAEDIIDPIAKAKMVALKGIKKVMAQGSIGVAPGMNR